MVRCPCALCFGELAKVLGTHLVSADKADSKCSQDFNDSGAVVASDWVEGPNLRHAALPEEVLTHQGPKVGHNKCILFSLHATHTHNTQTSTGKRVS